MLKKSRLLYRIPFVLLTALAVWASVTMAFRTLAQSIESPWQPPTNVSQSGATSQSRSAVTPDGTLHMIWWDTEKGEQYSYSTNISGTTWASSISLPDVYNRRDQDTQTGKVILSQPSDVQLVATTKGDLYIFWSNVLGELLSARARGGERARDLWPLRWRARLTLRICQRAFITAAIVTATGLSPL